MLLYIAYVYYCVLYSMSYRRLNLEENLSKSNRRRSNHRLAAFRPGSPRSTEVLVEELSKTSFNIWFHIRQWSPGRLEEEGTTQVEEGNGAYKGSSVFGISTIRAANYGPATQSYAHKLRVRMPIRALRLDDWR